MDLRHAWRSIRRMPVLACVVVVSLGIGIGVNTAVFSWLQAVVLRPLPGVADARAFQLIEPRQDTGSYPGVSWPEYRDLRDRVRAFPSLVAFRMAPLNVGETGRAQRTFGLLVSGNYFTALGLTPALGRFLRADEVARPGGDPVVVVSHDFWRTRMAGAPAAVGQTLRVNDRSLTVIGVAPERFQGTVIGLHFDLFVPATLAPTLFGGSNELEDRSLRDYHAIGALGPRVTRTQAQVEVDGVMRDLAIAYPETNANLRAEVLQFWQAPRGPQRMLANAVAVLQGVMLLLLLAVCGNTANLMLARASARRREIGVRLALGAGPWRIASLVLTENLMLALFGCALGVAIAAWATDALRAVPIITAFPIRFQTYLDLVTVAFALGLAIVCGVAVSVLPALQLARIDPQTMLRAGARDAGRSRVGSVLMAVEVGLALLVLIASGLFLRSFSDAHDTDPGFRREGVLLTAYDFTSNAAGPDARDFTRRLLDRLRAMPGVESAAVAAYVPLDIHGLPARSFTVEGHARSDGRPDRALTNTVTPGYFQTMEIPIAAGNDFVELADAKAPAQAIVNQEFVRRFLDGGDASAALGRRLDARGTSFVVVGVVRNSLSDSFGEPPTPVLYVSYRDRPTARGEIHLRTRPGAEALLAPSVERIVRDLDPSLPAYDARTLVEHVEKNLFLRRIPARMFLVLGPLLLVLAAIGIYAVVAHGVSLRTTEIGVRLAMGATARTVVLQIVRETLRVIAWGAALAWTLALLVKLHLVPGPISLAVFIGIPLVLLTVAGVAAWIPARRATEVDVMAALRQQ
jgi:predicted permease